MCDPQRPFCDAFRVASQLLNAAMLVVLISAPLSPGATADEQSREIGSRHWFPEALHPSRQPTAAENRSLLAALSAFVTRTNRDDVAAIETFLADFPAGAWNFSLRTELGSEYYRTGWYSKAVEAWEQVWRGRTNAGANAAQLWGG